MTKMTTSHQIFFTLKNPGYFFLLKEEVVYMADYKAIAKCVILRRKSIGFTTQKGSFYTAKALVLESKSIGFGILNV